MERGIEASGLRKTYRGEVRALEGATFEVGYGEIFAYLGSNGSGKTTTVRILTTLTSPTDGAARVAGHDVLAEPQVVRRSIGVTMQEAALDVEMTGREHLEFIAGLWGLPSRKIKTEASGLLEEFELAHAADRLIGTYLRRLFVQPIHLRGRGRQDVHDRFRYLDRIRIRAHRRLVARVRKPLPCRAQLRRARAGRLGGWPR